MVPKLDDREARVIGCLLEKAVVTPDQYPLTLNALTSACNQKSSREPVMQLDPGEVQRVARGLEERALVNSNENFRSGVIKFEHRFCNTELADLVLTPAQYAVVCVLLLRGAQTPGELRSRSGRLYAFADNEEVGAVLVSLMEREGEPLVARLPRTAGRRDSEYMHLFFGPIESAPPEPQDSGTPRAPSRLDALEQRIAALEAELAALKGQLGAD